MNSIKIAGVLLVAATLLGGCASSMSGGAYTRSQARQVQEVQMGVVESVRQVQLEGTKTPVGTIAGAAVGGIAGSNIGGGKGSTVGAILGAVAGGVAGSAIEEGVTKKPGLEITVKLDSGRMIAITQEADEDIRPGDRVRILSGGGVTRVTRN
ncbi:MAG: glycine zipper 2TM domain-containing protein [Sulfurimicrobium sp.]|jgi:outer membrane lipoprotein SlyB|nr:glycine zipper 2TM domain-containing protein [Sulfurimicrobium sp.]MDO9190554.1 glycine zipper 2TM domain-containing protein [Sulfurimicrobium sp.]MDP1705316.1 glycine zipper 2TM domain-containing protein [Sulfurimicrobium sp.]MDP2199832.1 glycine zipper 2TM domain-containing protein [Sulfurimicrobium sp.]MDP2961460.1 glycine zipper 2TM domain-containing protein [Sulfurimicrobium sp.]